MSTEHSVALWLIFKIFHSKMSSVRLNFECRCQANFCLNVACRMKKWANVACRNKAFMGPNNGLATKLLKETCKRVLIFATFCSIPIRLP